MEKAWYPTPEAVLINEIIPTLERAGIDPFDYDLQGILEEEVSVDYTIDPSTGEPVFRFGIDSARLGTHYLDVPWVADTLIGLRVLGANYWTFRKPDGEVVRGNLDVLAAFVGGGVKRGHDWSLTARIERIAHHWGVSEEYMTKNLVRPQRTQFIISINPTAARNCLSRWQADHGVAPQVWVEELSEQPSLDAAFPTVEFQQDRTQTTGTVPQVDEIMQLLKPAWLLPSTGVEK